MPPPHAPQARSGALKSRHPASHLPPTLSGKNHPVLDETQRPGPEKSAGLFVSINVASPKPDDSSKDAGAQSKPIWVSYTDPDHGLVGTTDWKSYTIEIAVPIYATNIALGAHTYGPGILWFDDARVEIIDNISP